jgi:hypothetical protein
MALPPAVDPANPSDFTLVVVNDNDFLATNGFQAGAAYKAENGVDTLMLACRVTPPKNWRFDKPDCDKRSLRLSASVSRRFRGRAFALQHGPLPCTTKV